VKLMARLDLYSAMSKKIIENIRETPIL